MTFGDVLEAHSVMGGAKEHRPILPREGVESRVGTFLHNLQIGRGKGACGSVVNIHILHIAKVDKRFYGRARQSGVNLKVKLDTVDLPGDQMALC
jgi:hypothetical protein